MIQVRHAHALLCGLAAALAVPLALQPAGAQGPGPGGFGGFPAFPAERPLVRQFDRDGNDRLDAGERKAARTWLASQPQTGPGVFLRRGGPGGRGGPLGGRGFAPSSAGTRVSPADVPVIAEALPLYDTAALRTLFLQFDDADWEQELSAFYNTDVDVPATLTVDGRTYGEVGVHFRGASSFMMVPEGSKRSLNLAIDFADDDQRLMGYRTLNLLNGNGDPTLVRALVYAEIARHYLPTPKTNYVRVAINGESWGVYINAQQFNSDFVREWFGTTAGARWKVPGSPFGRGGMEYLGDDVDAYRGLYEIKTRDNARSWSDLIGLFRVLNTTPPNALEAALAPILDVDGVLKFLALEVALVNSDGYWTRASDYNIYQDTGGTFHVIPHDVNEALAEEGGGRGRGGPPPGFAPPGFPQGGRAAVFGGGGVELDPLVGLDDPTKPLRSKLLAVPALRARYEGYVRDIAERWLDWTVIEPLATQYQTRIVADVKADTRKLYTFEAFQTGLAEGTESLKGFVERRRAYLLRARP